MSANRILAETASIAGASITDFVDHWDDDGAPVYRDMENVSKETLAAVKKIRVTTHTKVSKDGDEHTTKVVEFELHDKLRALELLGKNKQMFTDTVKLQGQDGYLGPVVERTIVVLPDNGRGYPVGAVERPPVARLVETTATAIPDKAKR
jgi:hypothetical protein